MSAKSERQFVGGNRNPHLYGLSIRSSSGQPPPPEEVDTAARRLGRPAFFVDQDGYECEMFAASVDSSSQRIAYVQSRSKLIRRPLGKDYVNIRIKVHLTDGERERSADIESYNPFFGCDVRYFCWQNANVLLIYQEKHDTYACRFGDVWPPEFVKIEDSWLIHDSVIHYVGYKATSVQRLGSQTFARLPDLPLDEADALGVLPL